MKKFILILASLFLTVAALGQTELDHLADAFFDQDKMKVGIEIELTGLPIEQIRDVLQAPDVLGGTLEEKRREIPIRDPNTGAILKMMYVPWYKLQNSKAGKITIKIEGNELDPKQIASNVLSSVTSEIITNPIKDMAQLELVQSGLNILRERGAQGTAEGHPVSIQVNLQVVEAQKVHMLEPMVLVNLLVNYLGEKNRSVIAQILQVPDFRKSYLGDLSPGARKVIFDPNFQVKTWAELYDILLYRQTAESFMGIDAWTANIETVRREVLAKFDAEGIRSILPVVKWNYIRYSSLLLLARPEDPLTKKILATYWIKALPIVEFREANNDFDMLRTVKRMVGFAQASLSMGRLDLSHFSSKAQARTGQRALTEQDLYRLSPEEIAARTGLHPLDVPRLREYLTRKRAAGETPLIRLLMDDVERFSHRSSFKSFKENLPFYTEQDALAILLGAAVRGVQPLQLGPNSVVLHRRPFQGTTILGEVNPGIENEHIARALENKWFEYLFWKTYAPNAMAKTIHLSDLYPVKTDSKQMLASLNAKFPEGWVMKGVWDLATGKKIITSSPEIIESHGRYMANPNSFQEFYKSLVSTIGNTDADYFVERLQKHPDYLGWKLQQLLKNPRETIVQSRLSIAKEFRVEVLGGQVLAKGSTHERWAFENPGSKAQEVPEEIKGVEGFAQYLIDRLPPALRLTPFAFDVAKLSDGSFRLIESNAGANSGFLTLDGYSIVASNKFLLKTAARKSAGTLKQSLSEAAQVAFLEGFFRRHGINPAQDYPYTTFDKSGMKEKSLKSSSDVLFHGVEATCEGMFRVF